MCSVVVLIRPGHAWPLVLAANRDEMLDRPWDPPAAYWPDQPDTVAGRDRTGAGTWMAVKSTGVVATVLNRPGSLGPAPGKRSRGELPLRALRAEDARSAAGAVAALDAGAYRSFNMVLADRTAALFVRGLGAAQPELTELGEGVHMVTAHDPDDLQSPRIARHLPRFRSARPPDPPDWDHWRAILSDGSGPPVAQMNVRPRGGFGTVCSSFLALSSSGGCYWLFAGGPPDSAPFRPVELSPPL
jgi:Transport and Golgi organisation 2